MAGRSHKKSNHRWSSKEIEAFLAAIKDELGGNKHKFEKPTAPIFYEKIKNRVPDLADMTHLHLKNKFNYLKKSYMNAVNWKNSTGVGTLTEGETIEDRLLLMCKYFHELDEILSGKKNVNPPRIVDTLLEQPELEENNFNNLEDIIVEEHYGEDEDVENILASTDAISDEPVPVENLRRGRSLSPLGEDSVAPKPKRQRGAQSGPAYALLKMQEQRLESEKIRTEQQVNVEKEKITIEQGKLDLERDKMAFERTKFETEMELKQKEMEQQLKLKELEMECEERKLKMKLEFEERIKIYELELAAKSKK